MARRLTQDDEAGGGWGNLNCLPVWGPPDQGEGISLRIEVHFLASLDECVRGANVIALVSASLSALDVWTKTLTLAITFLTEEIGLSYYACVFIVTRPFSWYRNFLTLWPWPWSLTYFWKTLTLAITFLPEEVGLSYCTCVFLETRLFTMYLNFWLRDLDLEVWLLKNCNHGFYLVMVAAWRA